MPNQIKGRVGVQGSLAKEPEGPSGASEEIGWLSCPQEMVEVEILEALRSPKGRSRSVQDGSRDSGWSVTPTRLGSDSPGISCPWVSPALLLGFLFLSTVIPA